MFSVTDERRYMGTNYYLATSNKEVKDKYLRNYTLTDEPMWAYEIHIAKISSGWLPLFQAHDGAFNSYEELRKLVATGLFILYDEYRRLLTWEEFDSKIQSWMVRKDELDTHLSPECYGLYAFKDSEGYEFTRRDFG